MSLESPRRHPWDDMADEITSWLDTEPEYYAQALLAGHDPPFGAQGGAGINEQQKLDYYKRQVFNTTQEGGVNYDSPNEAGREKLIKRVGIPGYTQVMAAVLGERNQLQRVPLSPQIEEPVDNPTPEPGGMY